MTSFTKPSSDMNPDFSESSSKRIMLYVGALYDAYPLTLPEIRRAHDCIIYTDALPASGAYKNLTHERQILDILMEEGGQYGVTSEFTVNREDGSYECFLKDNCLFKYFFNASNIDTDKIPVELLTSVTTLWLHGYEPPSEEIGRLPGLKMVYSGGASIGDTYWQARSMIHPLDDEVKVKFFDLKTRIPDVLHWTPDNGFTLAGPHYLRAHLLICDAPYQYEVFEDDDDDDIGDDDNDIGDDDAGRWGGLAGIEGNKEGI